MALMRPKKADAFFYLQMLYLQTEKSIINELKRQQANELVDYGTYAALMRVQQTLQNMQDESFQYVPQAVNKIFRDANARAGYAAAEALSTPQTAIVEQLVGNLLGNITEAAEQAYKTSESVLQLGRLHPDVFRNPVLLSSAMAEAEGRGMSPAVTRALHSLQNDNITSFVDKSGREWGLTEYCTMATRTVRTQATVAANLTSDDWDLWKITPNGSTCALCAAYEGRVYSKSGTNPDYPPLSTAFGKIDPAGGNDLSNTYLNIHPNCLHSLVRYTTAGRTDEEIQKDKDFSSFEKRPADVDYRTKKQIEEYREKERKRAEFLATRRQWNDYRERLGKEIPSLGTFEKHKKAGDDKYKAWEKAYRKKGAELRKENPELFEKKPKTPPKPPTPVKTVEEWRKEYTQAEAQTRRINAEIENSRDYIRRAENQNRDLRKQLEDFPESRFAQRYRDRIALNEETIRTETEKVKALEMEHARAYAAQVKAEDAIVSDFLQGTHTIQDPSMAEGLKNTNPHFEPNRRGGTSWDNPAPYNMNCQRCVFTYEARRRGYDVTAQPTFKGDKLPFNKRWTGAIQGTVKPEEGISAARNVTVRKNIEKRMAEFGEGSRAIVSCQWKGCNYGHVFIAEQIGGKTMFIDPQTGKTDVAEWYFKLMKPGQTGLYRIDDKKFSPVIEQMFSKGDK